MITNNKSISAQEFVRDWSAKQGLAGNFDAHLAPTRDHKIIVTAIHSQEWLELPGDNPVLPISRAEREQISEWLKRQLPDSSTD